MDTAHCRPTARLGVDWSQPAGTIRRLHGGAEGPRCFGGVIDLTEYHDELRFPVNRVQHPDWPEPASVDVHTVFPDMRADPTRPESYDFRRTDDHVRAIVATGSQICYRLGEPIQERSPRYPVRPPADPGRWAEVCAGIARHYTQGWANGFDHAVRYWEIWNEPDGGPRQWAGTADEYYRLYEVASKAVKAACPDVMVGGPALAFLAELGQDPPECPPFADGFLRHVTASGAPLDFFSWHWYGYDPAEPARRAAGVRRMLDERGFSGTESHLNEWNYLPPEGWGPVFGLPHERHEIFRKIHGMPGAAFAAAVLVRLQDAPVDVANFYTTDTQAFFGMFDPYGVPRAPYHAFRAFKALVDLRGRVATSGGYPASGLHALAAVDPGRTQAAVLLANPADPRSEVDLAFRGLPWAGPTIVERSVVYEGGLEVVSSEHVIASGDPDTAGFALSVPLEAPGVTLVRLRPGPREATSTSEIAGRSGQ